MIDPARDFTRRRVLSVLAGGIAAGVAWPTAVAAARCAQEATAPAKSTTDASEWAALSAVLDSHQVAYDAPSTISNTTSFSPDGPLMGNGTVLAFMGGDRRTQRIHISRTDMWEDMSASNRDVHFTGFGGFSISSATTTDGVFGYRQDLPTAQLTAVSEAGFRTRTWLSAVENLIVSEISNSTARELGVDVLIWTMPPSSSVNTITTTSTGHDAAHGIAYATKEARSDKYDWSVNAAVAVRVLKKTTTYTTVDASTSKLSFKLAAGETVTLVAAVEGGKDSPTYVQDATATVLARSNASVLASAEGTHRAWWQRYWMKSHIQLAGQSRTLERLYYGQLYQLGCALAAQSEHNAGLATALFPWTAHANPAWQGDYTMNTDVQRPMHVSVGANRTDHIANYSRVMEDFWEVGRSLASDPAVLNDLVRGTGHPTFTTGIRGVLFPTHIGPWGSRTEYFRGPNDFWHSPSNGASAVVPLVKYWRYTRDATYLSATLYPMLKDLAQFWEDFLVWDAGRSRYVVYGATFETASQHHNPILDLMACHFVLTSAIEAGAALRVDAPDRARWQQILKQLSPYPTGKIGSGPGTGVTTFVEADGVAPKSYNNPEVIHGTYFFNAIGMSDLSDAERVRSFITYLQTWNSDKAMRAAVAATTVGADITKLVDSISANIINPAPGDWVGMRNNHTYGDIGASIYLGFVHNSLLQSDEGFVHVFPNWYKDQQASFTRLRANGAFLVDAAQDQSGTVTSLSILSEQGLRLAVFNPWQGVVPRVYENGVQISATKSTNSLGEVYTFPTRAGATYALKR